MTHSPIAYDRSPRAYVTDESTYCASLMQHSGSSSSLYGETDDQAQGTGPSVEMGFIAEQGGVFFASSSGIIAHKSFRLDSSAYKRNLGRKTQPPRTLWTERGRGMESDTSVVAKNIAPAVLNFCEEHGVEVSAYNQMEAYAREVMAAFGVAAAKTRHEIVCLEADEICMLIITVDKDVDTVADLNFKLCGKMAATESLPANVHAMFEAL